MTSLIAPVAEQPEYNMFCRERVEVEYRPLQEELDYGATTFSPLACGVLTGKYNNGVPDGSRLAPNPEQLKEEIEHLKSAEGPSHKLGSSSY